MLVHSRKIVGAVIALCLGPVIVACGSSPAYSGSTLRQLTTVSAVPPTSGSAVPSSSDAGSESPLVVAADAAHVPWASSQLASLGPGVQAYIGDSQCTTNFVFVDDAARVYLGQAAHCSARSEKNADGCSAEVLPLQTPVSFRQGGGPHRRGAVIATGQLAYSSWNTMQQVGEKDQSTCTGNDFALVQIAGADAGKINPSVPAWGGPTGLNTHGATAGQRVLGYGNSSLRLGLSPLSPQLGTVEQAAPDDGPWVHRYVAPRPGIPGDSGSAILDDQGEALGTVSTLAFSIPLVNTCGDLNNELHYAREHSGISGLRLVLGDVPFSGPAS